MKIKTQDLIGPALRYAVAVSEGLESFIDKSGRLMLKVPGTDITLPCPEFDTNWAQGGPIIERERMHVYAGRQWTASSPVNFSYGHTLLIAAMRCRVASKLGDEVEVPEELA